METIGDIIRQWRGDRSQAEAARLLGISQTHLSDLELNKKEPGKNLIRKLVKETGRPLEVFFKAS